MWPSSWARLPITRRCRDRPNFISFDVTPQTARQQLAELFKHRVGRTCDMGVDPLEVALHVEM
jgi:hypothetical protein